MEALESRIVLANAIFESGVLTIRDEQGEDNAFVVQRVGDQLQVSDTTPLTGEPSVLWTDVLRIEFDAGSGDDSLTVEMSGGDPIPVEGLLYGGGDNTTSGDSLTIQGNTAPFDTVTYAFDDVDSSAGVIQLDTSTITYTGLEPIVNLGDAMNVVFQLPNGVVNPDVMLAAEGGISNRLSGSTFEDTVFVSPSSSLTINMGALGNTVSVEGLAADFDADVVIRDGAGVDTIRFQTVATNLGSGSLIAHAEEINVEAAITSDGGDAKLITTGDLAIEQPISLGNGSLFLNVPGNVTQTALGTITAGGLGLMVGGTTRLELANDVDTLAAETGDTILVNDIDGLTVGTVTALVGTADEMQLSGITTTDDDVKLITGNTENELTLAIEQPVNVGAAVVFLSAAGDVSASGLGTITAAGLGLMVGGNTRLPLGNDVDTLAADTDGTILFNDIDGLTIGTVTVFAETADEMELTGITTSNDDVKLVVGENLSIEQAINLGTGDLFLSVPDVTQTEPGTIIAGGLGLMVVGAIRLDLANDIDTLAVSSDSTIYFNDIDELAIGTVTALDGTGDEMELNGIIASDDDVKLIVGDGVTIEQPVNVGTAVFFLNVPGDVSASGAGTITAGGLGLMVGGNTRLPLGNDVDTLAADTDGTILFNDIDGLTIGTVTVFAETADEMELTGITTSDDDVKLVVGENLSIEQAINVGAADVFLNATGNVTQTAPGTIIAVGLGLMVGGTTRLELANDVDTLSASNGGTTLFNDIDGLTIGTVTVLDGTADEMKLDGIITTDDDVKLVAVQNVSIEQAINLGAGDLFLSVPDVTQTEPGTITAGGLALMVSGAIRLDLANDIDTLAASTDSTILFNDIDGLTIGTVTVLDGTADEMELSGITTTDDDVKLITGNTENELTLAIEQPVNVGAAVVFLSAAGDVSASGLGTITAAGLGLMVEGNTRLPLGNDVDTLAADTDGTILFNDIDDLTIGTVTVFAGTADEMELTGITTSDDDVKLIVGDNLLIDQAISLGSGELFLSVPDVTQSELGTITAGGLALMVSGAIRLEVDVDTLAASTDSTILLSDIDGLTIGTVTVLDGTSDEMELVGITTSDDDVKLILGGNLAIEQPVNVGTAVAFLSVTGDVNASGSGTITAAGLGLMVSGNTRLPLANDVDTLAADTGGTILFNDIDDLTIGTVTVFAGTADEMELTGITTSDDDVKLIVGENLSIDQAINLGAGDLFLSVMGNVTQTAPGTITAAGLGLMVDGVTRLELANVVDTLAASNGGTTLFNDIDDLTIGTVTVLDGTDDEMELDGIISSDDVKLVVGDGVTIEQPVNVGTAVFFLNVPGDVSASDAGTITAGGLGLMVGGNTRLPLGNDVDTLAVDTDGTILFNDIDGLTIGTVSVFAGTADEMELMGITTSDDDVKLIVGENLSIEQAINLGAGDLFLSVAGNVTQITPGTITAARLGVMVSGTTRLELANDVDTLAASNGGTTLFNDIDGLTIGIVTVLDGTADEMNLEGILTSDDDVKLIVGEDLSVEQAINLGTGDLFLSVTGNVTQITPGTITAGGLGLMVSGTTRLELANDVDTLAASTDSTILFNDIDGLTIGIVTVLDGTADEMQLSGITTSDDDVKLIVGENLSIEQPVNVGTAVFFLSVSGNVEQVVDGAITAGGLGLMVGGNTRLPLGNDVDRLASESDGTILFNDIDGLIIGTVTVFAATADEMEISGITTSDDDVKLVVGENLSIEQPVDVGTAVFFLSVSGNVAQVVDGTITASAFGLMVGQTTNLSLANDVDTLAADTQGTVLFNDIDGLTIGTVTVFAGTADEMELTGITTSDDDVKLIVGEKLSIEQAINLGAGDLFLSVTGNVTQTAPGTIAAAGLGLMVDGTTRLELANVVDTLAASNGGTLLFNDVDDLTIGTVTVLDGTGDEMELDGIISSDDDVKLIVTGSISIQQPVDLGSGDLFLSVPGNVSQADVGTVTAGGLGLMVGGTSRLELANDIDRLAASTDDIILFNDVDGLTVGTVTALDGTGDEMELVGITTSDDDVKLIAGGNLAIEQLVNLGTAVLFLSVTGDIAQGGEGTIVASGLGIMGSGTNSLSLGNDVDTLAADTGGSFVYNDIDGLIIGTVAVFADSDNDRMQLVGITVADGSITVTAGSGRNALADNSMIVEADVISENSGDVSLRVFDSESVPTAPSLGDSVVVRGGVTVESIDGDVSLQAGDNVELEAGSLVRAAGMITIIGDRDNTDSDPDPNTGSVINVLGTINAGGGTEISTGADNDVINLAPTRDPQEVPLARPTLDGITGNVNVDSGGNQAAPVRDVYSNVTAGFTATLAESIDEDDTTLVILPEDVSKLPTPFAEFQLHIGGEDMLVTSASGTVLTVERGTGTTEPQAHEAGTAITLEIFTQVIRDQTCTAAIGFTRLSESREVGDRLNLDDSAETTAHNYLIDSTRVERDGGLQIFYQNVDELILSAGSGNDLATVNMPDSDNPTIPLLPALLVFNGNGEQVDPPVSGMDPSKNQGDMFKVIGSIANDNILVGRSGGVEVTMTVNDSSTTRTVHYPFAISGVEFVKEVGDDGYDDLLMDAQVMSTQVVVTNGMSTVTDTMNQDLVIQTLMEGQSDNDIMIGGNSTDVMAAGAGADFMMGRDGDDFLFADVDFVYSGNGDEIVGVVFTDPPGGAAGIGLGDLIDGGNGTDSAFQVGFLDIVKSIEGGLIDGGACKDVFTWLQGKIISTGAGNGSGVSALNALIQRAFEALDFTWDPVPVQQPDPVNVSGGSGQVEMDVNGDGSVTALDALRVINVMARQEQLGSGAVAGEQVGSASSRSQADVNADGQVSGLDALLIINELQRQASVAAQSEQAVAPTASTSSIVGDANAFENSAADSLLAIQTGGAVQSWADAVDSVLSEVIVDDGANDDVEDADPLDLLSDVSRA